MRVLVVEDDALLGDAIQAGLRQQGFVADWVRDGAAADLALEQDTHAAVVLDIGLPRRSGLEVLARLRAAKNPVPVLILTARDTVEDRIGGLDAGADDYLVKPFDLGELAARLRALTRRSGGTASAALAVGALSLDPATREVTWRGEAKALSRKEFSLLHAFMLNAGRVLTREQLEEKLYGWGEEIESNAMDVHLHHLRRKIVPGVVQTLRGVGYVMPKDLA
ncbi:MAG: response regulator transcription factor [Betaproteobacteria bacterium]|nr:response regulator transcription factor [Betaproteobacteria bacterium]